MKSNNIKTEVPWQRPYKDPIRVSNFDKKGLATYKIDLDAFCQFHCSYCTTNTGNSVRIPQRDIEDWTEKATGKRLNCAQHADQFYLSNPRVILRLREQLMCSRQLRQTKSVLQVGMLTDCFGPKLVADGTTFEALNVLLKYSDFSLRILSKSKAVALPQFVELYQKYPNRVTVGVSCGSINDAVMKTIEVGTTVPTSRAKAIRTLQEAGVRTYGMFCPILPGMDSFDSMSELYEAFNPSKLEDVWCEPFNERSNFEYFINRVEDKEVKAQLILNHKDNRKWAKYALSLAESNAKILKMHKFKGNSTFLLYESKLTTEEIEVAKKIPGVLFQSDPNNNEALGGCDQ